MIKQKISFFIILFILSTKPNMAIAKEEGGYMVGVSPTIIEQILTPGETVVKKIKLFNLSSRPMPIKVQVHDFIEADDPEVKLDESISAKEWIDIQPADFILEGKESQEVVITTTTPISATPGGHYSTIFFTPVLPIDFANSQNSKVLTRVAVQQLYLVKGEIKEKLEISNFKSKYNIFFGEAPSFNLQLNNSGNIHLIPKGSIFIESVFRKYKAEIKLDNKVVLPDSTRNIELAFEDKIGIGKYRSKVVANYGSEMKKIESSYTEFVVLPHPLLLVLTLTISISIMILTRYYFSKYLVRKN